ncbi:MAG: hypothetical protein MI748_09870, partial [Opitutales bacterium]|nr:hypothetical protein [Opitutales bacterium]
MDKLTSKAQQAIQDAAAIANRNDHATLESLHLARALVSQDDGIVVSILKNLEIPVGSVADALDAEIRKLPKVHGEGAQLRPSNGLARILAKAEAMPGEMGDSFVSTEHLLTAILESKDKCSEILHAQGLNSERVRSVLDQIRGGRPVDGQDPEGRMQVLEKYCKDLTALARREKIDPVIG